MPWVVLHIDSDREHHAELEQALLDRGAAAVTLQDGADQPLFEPGLGETPLWQQICLSGLFKADDDIESIRNELLCEFPDLQPGSCQLEILEDKDWLRTWMDDYQPIQIGTRLWVCPSWKTPPDPAAVNLKLDPGMAFGTGTHPTTALCLQWLDQQALSGKSIIDYGCGSGILAIAALLLGARTAIGIDIDPQALRTARENAERNGLHESQLELYLPHQLPEHALADTVLANILAAPLVALAPTLTRLVAPGGQLLLSGILQHQAPAVEKAYPSFEFRPARIREEWALLSATRIGD